MTENFQLDPRNTALLVMDFQNDIVGRGGPLAPSDEEALQRIEGTMAASNLAAEAARRAGIPVIHVGVGRKPGGPPFNPHAPLARFMMQGDTLVEGTEGFDFHPSVQPKPGEMVIIKRGVSALAGTELNTQLRGQGLDTLVLCGFATHMVIVGTAREAVDSGYLVVVLEDCCTSGGLERHTAVLENLRMLGIVTDSTAFIAALEK